MRDLARGLAWVVLLLAVFTALHFVGVAIVNGGAAEQMAGGVIGAAIGFTVAIGAWSAQRALGTIDEALERFGRLDAIVPNAGIQHVAPVDEFPEATWDQIQAPRAASGQAADRA